MTYLRTKTAIYQEIGETKKSTRKAKENEN